MIPVAGGKDKDSLRLFTERCKVEIEKGHLICIFPEGMLSRNGQLMPFKKGIEHISKVTGAPIFPVHIDNVVGTPLSYKTGTSNLYGFNIKTLRKKVFITVDKALPSSASAFELRQSIKELEVKNFANRTKKLSAIEAANVAKKQVFKRGDVFTEIKDVHFEQIVVNTPNYTIKDLMGNQHEFVGSKENSAGKPLPGVTIAIKDDKQNDLPAYAQGKVFFKHAFDKSMEWLETEYVGFLDESGFLQLSK
jgi:hypothetical protein